MTKHLRLALTLLSVAAPIVTLQASADTITLSAIRRGTYDSSGTFQGPFMGATPNASYAVGALLGDLRNFFVFDLSLVTGTITSAQLDVLNNGKGVGSALTYNVRNYGLNPDTLNGTENYTGYSYLNKGTLLGTTTFDPTNASVLNIAVTADGLNLLQGAEGKQYAFGGSLVRSPIFSQATESAFIQSNGDPLTTLTLTTATAMAPTPEPSSLALAGTGALAIVGLLRRRLAR